MAAGAPEHQTQAQAALMAEAGPRRATFALVLLLAGLALHFFRIGQPAVVVFDEVHFGGFADAYCCSGEYFFDVHPPHGKLLAALGMRLGGYDGGQTFASIGTPLLQLDPLLLRLVPAISGSLIPVLVFLFLTQLGASAWAAFLGGWAALFDNALLVQTRVLALEGPLLVSILAGVILALAATRQRQRARQAVLSLGAGICVGFAVGTKFTGLTSALLVAVILLAPLGRRAGDNPAGARLGQVARLCGWAALGAAITYLGGWALHFSLLDRPGPGDIWGVPKGKLVQDIVNIHLTMLKANYGLGATHPNGSPWWAWPWMWRPIYYYASPGSAIYLLGNPVVWWGTSLGMLCVLWTSVREALGQGPAASLSTRQPMIRLLPLLGFLVSYLPYLVIPRVMFLYHYLPSLVFAICAVALWLDQRGWTRPGRFADQPRALRWLIILIPLGFLLVGPLSYGLSLPEELLGWLARLVHR